ncbi:MAG: LysM peptidoglycan-binding domain-containing protein [Bacillota bacterium]|nr:LysM peptidoglycan-binding domain-containing protein [Bacillota bacterium]
MKTLSAFSRKRARAAQRRRKIINTSTLFLLCLLVMSLTFFNGSVASGENSVARTMVIAEGDTLWKLAGEHAPRGMDIRDYLDEILTVNNITDSIVYPGQEIILP